VGIHTIKVTLGEVSKISQSRQELVVKSDSPEFACAQDVCIEFDDSYAVEIKENAAGKTLLVFSSGGISRTIDTAALQHLIAMTY